MGELLGRAAFSLAIALVLTGCQESQDDPEPTRQEIAAPTPEPTTEAFNPCLVTAEQLTEVIGVKKEPVPAQEFEGGVACGTDVDERHVTLLWWVSEEAWSDGQPVRQLRRRIHVVAAEDFTRIEVAGADGWQATVRHAVELAIRLDGHLLRVLSSAIPAGGPRPSGEQLAVETRAAAAAMVKAYRQAY